MKEAFESYIKHLESWLQGIRDNIEDAQFEADPDAVSQLQAAISASVRYLTDTGVTNLKEIVPMDEELASLHQKLIETMEHTRRMILNLTNPVLSAKWKEAADARRGEFVVGLTTIAKRLGSALPESIRKDIGRLF